MKERCSLPRRDDRSNSIFMSRSASRSRSSSRVSTNRDRIRCYKCREYDHFASECSNSATDEESDQYDSDRQSALQILAPDSPCRTSSGQGIDHLNL